MDLRPYTSDNKESYYANDGQIEELFVCEFCGTPCDDQTLLSWESCCSEFEMAMETDRLSEREANFERVASFFGGAPDQTPSMAEVLERARLSWEGEESVPVEWVTMLLCIREWNDNG